MANTPIKKGDVITIHEDNLPEGQWRLGKVEKLYDGNDGVVRGVELKKLFHERDGQPL